MNEATTNPKEIVETFFSIDQIKTYLKKKADERKSIEDLLRNISADDVDCILEEVENDRIAFEQEYSF